MDSTWLIGICSAVGGILLSLIVTTLYNKLIGLPKKWKEQRELERQEKEELMAANEERDRRIGVLEEEVGRYPIYREQSRQIQQQLENTDGEILDACKAIKEEVAANHAIMLDRLKRLENRDKNTLRSKILEEHRFFTDKIKNPMQAWSEMEHHSFFELVKDYEDLGGNDYVHSVVLPEMNRLDVILMSSHEELNKLYESRKN